MFYLALHNCPTAAGLHIGLIHLKWLVGCFLLWWLFCLFVLCCFVFSQDAPDLTTVSKTSPVIFFTKTDLKHCKPPLLL